MIDKEVITLEGVVLRKFPTEFGTSVSGKRWSKNKFVLKNTEGRDIYISKFGAFDTKLLGQDVRFQASKFNDNNYTVQGEISTTKLETISPEVAQSNAPSVQSEAVSVPKRGRPAKVKEVAEVPVPIESGSDEALQIVKANLLAARSLAESLEIPVTNLIDLADMIGRTRVALRIEANKDRRMDSFRK